MKLEEFNVGDKVYYVPGMGPADLHSEILYIGEALVVLRSSRDVEFVRKRDADGFNYWRPEPTYDELREANERLRRLGFDLYTAIRDAAWIEIDFRTNAEKPNLHGPTPHMKIAFENWKTEVEDRV